MEAGGAQAAGRKPSPWADYHCVVTVFLDVSPIAKPKPGLYTCKSLSEKYPCVSSGSTAHQALAVTHACYTSCEGLSQTARRGHWVPVLLVWLGQKSWSWQERTGQSDVLSFRRVAISPPLGSFRSAMLV